MAGVASSLIQDSACSDHSAESAAVLRDAPDLSWNLGAGNPGVASVIVTAYNQEWAIRETLASVAAQTYRPLECVVVNDGSTDATPTLIDAFAQQQGPGFAVQVLHQQNGGLQNARNAGTRASTGEFIQYLDGDDMLAPRMVEEHVSFLLSETGQRSDVVYGEATWLYDDDGVCTTGKRFRLEPPLGDFIVSLLNLQSFNVPFSYTCRRPAVERCGKWDTRYRINEDVDYFLRMACSGGRFHQLFSNDGFYRVHGRPRMSVQSLLVKAEANLTILKMAESKMREANMLNPNRTRALAHAFYVVSWWASPSSAALWRESIEHVIRLCPDLQLGGKVSRLTQKVLGTRRNESLKRKVREWRQTFAAANVQSELA